MKTVAIDASSTCSGWSLFDDGKYVDSGYIDLKKDKDSNHRIFEMAKQIGELISNCKPQKVILEDTMLSSNVSTLKLLANLAGAIKFYCYLHDFELETIYPSEWRKYLNIQSKGVKRNELKARALNVVQDQLDLDFLEEDRAEAVCINLAIAVRDGFFKLKEVESDKYKTVRK